MPGFFSAIKARAVSALNRVNAAFSLIPDFYANVRWLLSAVFLALVQKAYKQNAVAYACIRLLAESVPEAPLKAYRLTGEGEKEDLNHKLRRLIRNPNPLQTEFEFWELVTIHLNLVGISHWWKQRSNAGEVIALWPLRPDRMAPVYGKGLPPLVGWQYVLEGKEFMLPREDVLTFNLPDPEDPSGGIVEGLGPAQVLAREIESDNKATKFVFAMVSNYAMPGVLIKTKKKLEKHEADRLKANFISKYGEMNQGKPAILDNDSDVEPLSFNLRDLEFPDLRSIAEARIASAFRVPAILVGLKVGLDRSTFSNMKEAREFFAETTLSTFWTRLANQIQSDLVPEFEKGEDLFVRFDTSNVRALAGQFAEKVKPFADAFVRGGITRNEYREKLGFKPVPGGDVFAGPRGAAQSDVPAHGDPDHR